MLCLCFYVFFNGPGDSKHLGSAGRQADEYIAPRGKLLMFIILPISLWARSQNFGYGGPRVKLQSFLHFITKSSQHTPPHISISAES